MYFVNQECKKQPSK